MNLPFITVDHATFRLGDRHIFEQTSWQMRTNEHWGILGENGSGKSLFAEAICRSLPLAHGQIAYHFDAQPRSYVYKGEILKISSDSHRELLQQFADYYQARWQSFEGQNAPTVGEMLTGKSLEHRSPFEVTPLSTPEDVYQTRREQAIALLGIEYLLDRKILHLSHGEGRKFLLARALMQSPKLLILDDPFCGLDAASRDTLRQAVENLLSAGVMHILLLTSRPDEIPAGVTHLLHLAEMRVTTQGTRAAILKMLDAPQRQQNKPTSAQIEPIRFPAMPLTAGEADTPLIAMRNVSVTYGDTHILRNITWTMRQREYWAILGHNGAGKTTFLSLIAADNPQSYANDITLFGLSRGSGESIWEIKRQIGAVSPELLLYYDRGSTCQQVVCSGFFDSVGLYQDVPPEQAQCARAWMRALEIEHLADLPFQAASIGEERIVLLARALVKHPRLLILDEPCQGLDAHHRDRILALLDRLCAETPIGLLYVTHHINEMPRSITHILELEQGRIIRTTKMHAR
ncbi:ABC transporter related [Candidatus Moduliflexus flocculans]|uniref:ABC transporter related n=1 Tax=Candidatus Moduliflexus flocculans TaxID=1499966 RepID=A0A081BLT3_9BACT|nr:ABC transporter related [Candidatus Moduliflexus flocculans]